MKNNKIDTTSPLRQERNTNNPRTFLQNRNGTGIGSLIVRFMESLIERGIAPGMIVGFCTELRPFFEYIEDTYRVTAVADLERSHVEGYAAFVRTGYEAGEMTFTNANEANGLLCLYLQSAGVVAEDYGLLVPVILCGKESN